MRDKFWTLPLEELTTPEWEALCDRCGKCCLIKLEDEDTSEIVYTSLACKLFDANKCACSNYEHRKQLVDDCLSLSLDSIPENASWLPQTCSYIRRYLGQDIPKWHPLLTGSDQSMHDMGHSVKNKTTSEEVMIELEDAIDYIDRDLGP